MSSGALNGNYFIAVWCVYFLQVFDVPDDDGEDNLLIDECSMFTKMSNGKMIELMSVYELPESHIERVAMDLPIE